MERRFKMDCQTFKGSGNQLQDKVDPYNPSEGGPAMQANTTVLETDILDITENWALVRERATKVFTKERFVDALLVLANVTLAGTILFSIYKAMEISVYTGLGYAVLGHF